MCALSFKMCRAVAANGVAVAVLMHCCCGAVAVAVAAVLLLISAHSCLDSRMDFSHSSCWYSVSGIWPSTTTQCFVFFVYSYTQ